jgi:8-oxo-dGTP pyrophosphatase MutT (NUDIX family)
VSEPGRRTELRTDFQNVESRVREILAQRRRGRLGDLDPDPRRSQPDADQLVGAAVAVLLERAPGYNVVLTQRTECVEHHKGEISLAGGAQDPDDGDVVATALRETYEEIGIEPQHVSVLGSLDELVTVTRFRVTPVVCAVDAGLEYRPHAPEVERILRIPVHVLRSPGSWFEDVRTWRGKTYRLRSCRYGTDIVWGATSRILQNLLDTIPADVL